MDILIVTPFYTPDLGPSAPLFAMLSIELVQLGHHVTVVSAVPHYPTGKVQTEFRSFRISRNVENGVKVIRIPVPSMDRSNLINRFIQYFCFQIGATFETIRERFDMVVVSNPALWIWMPFTIASIFKKKPAIFSIHDLYPDVGVTLGVFKQKPVISVVTKIEQYVLGRSAYVRILSESFKPTMKSLGVSDEKMILIYDWVDTNLIKPVPRINGFSCEYNLTDKFVVMYAGNVGLTQGLEHVLTAAKILEGHDDTHFAIVGEGAARKELMTLAEEQNLRNVSFIPFQPRQRLPEVLSTADISLVSLRHGVGSTALPSKTYSIFASGKPILACVEEGCETSKLINQSKSGICIEPENPAELVKAILHLKDHPEMRDVMGKNGRKWAEMHHSPRSAALKIEMLFRQMIESRLGKLSKA